MSHLEEFGRELEKLIIQGEAGLARKRLSQLKPNQIGRKQIRSFASLARRLNLPSLALKILHPVVAPKMPLDLPPTPGELAIYGASLTKLGALDMAYNTLKAIEPFCDEYPEILLYLTYNFFARWDYKKSISPLKKFIRSPHISNYQRAIGQVNLAAAYVFLENTLDGIPLLASLLEDTKRQGWHLLYGNTLELSAQMALIDNDFLNAEKFLNSGSQYIPDPNSLSRFFIRKWQTVLEMKVSSNADKSIQKMNLLRKEAIDRRHWETLRDCDYYSGLHFMNQENLQKIYCGTPYMGFRERMKRNSNNQLRLPNPYHWLIGPTQTSMKAPILDVSLGDLADGDHFMKPNQILHRLIQVLSSDFYRPRLIGSIYHQLFPKEYFNPYSSPKRVTFAVQRLRQWLKKCHIPAGIEVHQGEYRLTARAPIIFAVDPRLPENKDKNEGEFAVYLRRLKRTWKNQVFSAQNGQDSLGVSRGLLCRILKEGIENESLYKFGTGKGTLYSFSKNIKLPKTAA